MFKITKFKICVIGMIVGVGLISLLPFMGMTCRWCTGAGQNQKLYIYIMKGEAVKYRGFAYAIPLFIILMVNTIYKLTFTHKQHDQNILLLKFDVGYSICEIVSIYSAKFFEHQCTISRVKSIACSIDLLSYLIVLDVCRFYDGYVPR